MKLKTALISGTALLAVAGCTKKQAPLTAAQLAVYNQCDADYLGRPGFTVSTWQDRENLYTTITGKAKAAEVEYVLYDHSEHYPDVYPRVRWNFARAFLDTIDVGQHVLGQNGQSPLTEPQIRRVVDAAPHCRFMAAHPQPKA